MKQFRRKLPFGLDDVLIIGQIILDNGGEIIGVSANTCDGFTAWWCIFYTTQDDVMENNIKTAIEREKTIDK